MIYGKNSLVHDIVQNNRQAMKTILPDDTDRMAEWFLDPADLNCDPNSAEGLLRRALVHHGRGELTQSQALLDRVHSLHSF